MVKNLEFLFGFNKYIKNMKKKKKYKIFFKWNQRDKITSSFYIKFGKKKINLENEKKNEYLPISYESCIDNMVILRVKEITNFEDVFKNNKKTLHFLIKILKDSEKTNKKLFQEEFEKNLKKFVLNKNLPGSKFIIINLLTIAEYFPSLENLILSKIISFTIELESLITFSNLKKETNEEKEYLDFLLKTLLNYIRIQIKDEFKPNKDLYLSKLTKLLKKIKKKRNIDKIEKLKRKEKIIDFLYNFFIDKILRIEGSKCIQFLVLYISKSEYKQSINTNFPNLEEYFIHKLLSLLFSKNNHDLLKEKALFYIYSFIKVSDKKSGFLYTVIFYLYRYFRKITKKIIWKIKKDYKHFKTDNLEFLEGKKKKYFLGLFNKGIYVKILYFLMKILTENLQNFSNENLIDIIKNFENYFSSFWTYIRILIKNNKKSLAIFSELNKTLKNPLVNDLLKNQKKNNLDIPNITYSISSIKTPSKCSFSSYSKISISSYNSLNYSKNIKNNWDFDPDYCMFDFVPLEFFKEFFNNNKKGFKSKRKMSLDTDNSFMMTPVKNGRRNEFSLFHD